MQSSNFLIFPIFQSKFKKNPLTFARGFFLNLTLSVVVVLRTLGVFVDTSEDGAEVQHELMRTIGEVVQIGLSPIV